MTDVFEKVKEILTKQLNVNDERITGDAQFTDDLGIDSIDSVELLMALETEFKIDISEKDAENFHNVDDVVKYLDSRLNVLK